MYCEKINLEITIWLSFQGILPFLGRDRLVKCTQFSTEHYSTHLPLIFSVQSLIISLERINVSGRSLLFSYFMKNFLLIVSYFLEVASKSLKSQTSTTLRRDFCDVSFNEIRSLLTILLVLITCATFLLQIWLALPGYYKVWQIVFKKKLQINQNY